MLKKLLKYDFKAVFRYWWMLLPTLPVLSILLGLAIRFLMSEEYLEGDTLLASLLVMAAVLFLFFGIILVSASALVTPILSLIRFYKHLYTDEGYLTFTLPVKRSTLLLSKVLNATIFNAMYVLLFSISVSLAILIVSPSAFAELLSMLSPLPAGIGGWVALFVLEGLLLLLALDLFSTLLLYLCVTIGALVVKKAKLVAGLAIYYGVTVLLSSASQLLSSLALPLLSAVLVEKFYDISIHGLLGLIALLLFIAIAAVATLALTLWSMTLGRIERKLNLP